MKIDAQTAIYLIRDAVDKNGEDYLYPIDAEGSCKYVAIDGVTPLCIVGFALRAVKVNFVIERLGLDEVPYNINGTIAGVLEPLQRANPDLEITNFAVLIFSAAQGAQDNGASWGAALGSATRVFETLSALDFEEKVVGE